MLLKGLNGNNIWNLLQQYSSVLFIDAIAQYVVILATLHSFSNWYWIINCGYSNEYITQNLTQSTGMCCRGNTGTLIRRFMGKRRVPYQVIEYYLRPFSAAVEPTIEYSVHLGRNRHRQMKNLILESKTYNKARNSPNKNLLQQSVGSIINYLQ